MILLVTCLAMTPFFLAFWILTLFLNVGTIYSDSHLKIFLNNLFMEFLNKTCCFATLPPFRAMTGVSYYCYMTDAESMLSQISSSLCTIAESMLTKTVSVDLRKQISSSLCCFFSYVLHCYEKDLWCLCGSYVAAYCYMFRQNRNYIENPQRSLRVKLEIGR